MVKKRKAGGRPYGEPKRGDADKEDSKLNITTFKDVADSEDEFHLNRDEVLLDEGPQAKRMRKWREQDEFLQPSDEEVLAYSDAAEDEDEEFSDEEDEEENGGESDISDDFAMRKSVQEGDEDELEGWGPSKKDYYNADAIETEQDALDEEAEARRIQQRQLQGMTEADFAFDEAEWAAGEEEGNEDGESVGVVTEVLPQLQITAGMGPAERTKLLNSRYPEFQHLANELARLQPLHDELAYAASAAEKLLQQKVTKGSQANRHVFQTPVAVVKHRALAAYLSAIAMYFAILTSTATDTGSTEAAIPPVELRDHPVIEGLLKCQQLWTKVEHLQIADPMVELVNGDDLSAIEEESNAAADVATVTVVEANAASARKPKKTKAQRAAEAAQVESELRRAEKMRRTERDLANLASLTDKSALRKKAKVKTSRTPVAVAGADDSDFGEEAPLTAEELAEKAKKKKSLRFYTSQIAQKANKRGAAGRDQGGDADVPHRERLKDRQARLQAEAEKRGKSKVGPGVELGAESDSDQGQQRDNAADHDDDEYYDLVAVRSKQKKQAKEDKFAAYARAAAEGGTVLPQEAIGADGKRQVTYQILANKGLTPNRKKLVRNPRVKKKEAYKAKLKKLRSQKPVYSGGQRGPYGGELTGIKKGLVKSVKL